MPTYGYQCTACKFQFQTMQKMSDDPITVCPECGELTKRLLYPVGIVFKGTGWYVNDSRPAEKSEASETPPAAAAPEKKADAPAKTDAAAAPAASAPASSDSKPAKSGE